MTGGQVPDKYETSSTVLQSGSGEEGNSSLQIDSWDGSSVLSYLISDNDICMSALLHLFELMGLIFRFQLDISLEVQFRCIAAKLKLSSVSARCLTD